MFIKKTDLMNIKLSKYKLTARALNSIFATWKIRASNEWNISGELCSGAAIDGGVSIDDGAYNPMIKCTCTFANSTCRITAV